MALYILDSNMNFGLIHDGLTAAPGKHRPKQEI